MKTPNRPVIIKRIKRTTGGGHHGGAWKVAYADFVTAMMAFFLLMWLINTSSDEQRRGLADFFAPSVPLPTSHSGGDGPFGGRTMLSADVFTDDAAHRPRDRGDDRRAARNEGPEHADQGFGEIEGALLALTGDAYEANPLLQHIRTRVTDEGLIIEIFDVDGSPLFVADTDAPTEALAQLTAMIGRVIEPTVNAIAVTGHTGSDVAERDPFLVSAARAHEVRRRLLEAGIDQRRMARVTGKADRDPFREDADDPRNRRIEIALLRRFDAPNSR
jgi:chemotaxis protein MotB